MWIDHGDVQRTRLTFTFCGGGLVWSPDDPYFPPAMKALLYADSPQDFDIYPAQAKGNADGLDILILSHDLTNSGAPRVAFDMVRVLIEAGHFVVVMAPEDGFFREQLVVAGATVIIEPLLLTSA